MQNSSFLMHNPSLLMQNPSFLMRFHHFKYIRVQFYIEVKTLIINFALKLTPAAA